MTASDATNLARRVEADLTGADEPTRKIGAVILLMADEVDRLAGVVERLSRQAR
jgi:HAMP domain-containing protein